MKDLFRLTIIGLLLLLPMVGQAQGVKVLSSLEPSQPILIGEQAHLQIKIVYPKEKSAQLILPKDTLVSGVEILQTQLKDSTTVNDKLSQLIYDVVITSFDSAVYSLSNIKALVGDSLYVSEQTPKLVVNTIKVDVSQPDKYSDIKDQWVPPFVWKDYVVYLYILLGILLLIILCIYIWRHFKRKQNSSEIKMVSPPKDPYEEAMEAMSLLKSRELYQKNMVKEYYTELTDILRRYIYRVYSIQTTDKTSAEILEAFKKQKDQVNMYEELKKILGTADLAKFAKYNPSSQENSSLLNASFAFIEENKPVPEDPEQKSQGGEEPTTIIKG